MVVPQRTQCGLLLGPHLIKGLLGRLIKGNTFQQSSLPRPPLLPRLPVQFSLCYIRAQRLLITSIQRNMAHKQCKLKTKVACKHSDAALIHCLFTQQTTLFLDDSHPLIWRASYFVYTESSDQHIRVNFAKLEGHAPFWEKTNWRSHQLKCNLMCFFIVISIRLYTLKSR